MSTISRAQNVLNSYGADGWLLFSDENSDPIFSNLVSDKTVAPALALVTRRRVLLAVHDLDAANLPPLPEVELTVYTGRLWEVLAGFLEALSFPPKLLLNYSTLGDVQVDTLGHGSYVTITRRVAEIYEKHGKRIEFASAEALVYALADRKTPEELEGLRLAARRAAEILDATIARVEAGQTEREVAALTHRVFAEKPAWLEAAGVIEERFAWDEAFCPVVLTGPRLAQGGHSLPSEQTIEPGHTLYFDFGVQLVFQNNETWSSDLQRMAYVLKDGENEAPAAVQRVFDTLVNAIQTGADHLRPGVAGHEVDSVVRSVITAAGYPAYDHATGHALGRTSHSQGTLLGEVFAPMAGLKVQPNGVYTLEPRIQTENGGSVEEMFVATDAGGMPLSPLQTSLYLIRG